MQKTDLVKIENKFNIVLPDHYKEAMLDYPFPDNSYACECSLVNDIEYIIECNTDLTPYNALKQPFVIGGNGGELTYLMDLYDTKSKVYSYSVESDNIDSIAESWQAFIDLINSELEEIAEDEKAEEARKADKKWWEFWK
jgi:hypothetical protein